MAVTIKDIAESLNITHTVVSQVLHDNPGVSEDTRKAVLKEIERTNYRPHRIARALRSAKTHLLAVIVPDIRLYFYPIVIRGIEDFASSKGYSTILCNTEEEWNKASEFYKAEEKAIHYLEALSAGVIDGFLMVPLHEEIMQKVYDKELAHGRLPFVFIDKYIKSIKTDYVVGDNIVGGYEITKHLINLGHKRIGFVSETLYSSTEDRLEGYKNALLEFGLRLDESLVEIEEECVQKEAGYKGMQALLNLPDKPTSVFCSNDVVASGAFGAIEEAGLRVPHDIAIAGYDDSVIALGLSVPLTSVNQKAYDIGQTATKVLIDKIEGKISKGIKQIYMAPQLVIRESSGGRIETTT